MITGRKALAMLLSFFAVIVLVNGVFMYFALTSFSGLSTENAYVKGVNYNRTLAQGRAQKAAGWQVTATALQVTPGRQVVLNVRVMDRHGRPLDNLALRGQLRRPTYAGDDVTLEFEATGKGGYRALADPDAAGQWDLRLLAQVDDATDYRWEKRLWLK
jgi:nitrogen fixation protein FixH